MLYLSQCSMYFWLFIQRLLVTTVVEMNSLEHQNYLTNPCFKECLFWAGRLHETYSDAIYDVMLKKWKNGPQFFTDDDEAKKFMKLLMIILGKPTKQASTVTGSLVKRGIEGQRFLMIRVLADYLLHVHLECSYIAYQAAAYLMGRDPLWSTVKEKGGFLYHYILIKNFKFCPLNWKWSSFECFRMYFWRV